MNLTSTSTSTQSQDIGPIGAGARQDYAISVAKKAQDHVKQEGAAIIQLIESIPAASAMNPSVGTQLNARA